MKTRRKAAGPFTALYRQSACQANQLAADIYSSADTQLGRELLLLLESGNYSPIVSASIDPLVYTDADTFSRDYLCAEIMSKFPHWDIGVNRSSVALQKFSEVERSLASLKFSDNPRLVLSQKGSTMRAIESMTRIKIAAILREFRWDEVFRSFAFGPGSSTSLSRRRGDAAFKFGALRPHVSYNAQGLSVALSKAHPTWRFEAEVVEGSKLITVPKNAKTDRCICVEPDLNMYFQKGIGSVIRKRLQRWGLLLPHAQQINAEYARQGSANGRLATVDLSSASDSIHIELVRLLLPSDWVSAIEQTRTPMTVLPSGDKHLLRKVSSMGNGFTFELETLIFYALCSSVITVFSTNDTDRQCTVFGDDIIIASELVPVLTEVLSYFGFTLNLKKSFYEGRFRESCGKHFFAGVDVTPIYVRDRIDSVPRKYWAANSVKRKARLHWGLDRRYEPVYNRLVSSIPEFFRTFKVPEGVGDGGLVSDWDEVSPSRSNRGYDAWVYEDIVPKFSDKELVGQGVLLKSLHRLELSAKPEVQQFPVGLGARKGDSSSVLVSSVEREFISQVLESESGVLPKPSGYRKHVGTIQQWPNFGPWI